MVLGAFNTTRALDDAPQTEEGEVSKAEKE